MRRLGLVGLVLAVAVAGCGAGTSVGVGDPGAMAPPTSTVDDDAVYECGGVRFTARQLADAAPATALSDRSLSALEGMSVPPVDTGDGWVALTATDDRLELLRPYARPRGNGPGDVRTHEVVAVGTVDGATNVPDGSWVLDVAGDCAPRLDLSGRGLGPAALAVTDAPAVDATEVRLDVLELACGSGQSAEGRVEVVAQQLTDTELRLVVGVRPADPDGAACPGNPSTPATVVLPEPLGARAVVDASTLVPLQLAAAPGGDPGPTANAAPDVEPVELSTSPPSGTDGRYGDAAVLGGAWLVVPGAEYEPPPGSRATLEVDAAGRLSGTAPCNGWSAALEATDDGGWVVEGLGQELAGCPEAETASEEAYLAAVAGATSWAVPRDDVLVLDGGPSRLRLVRQAPLDLDAPVVCGLATRDTGLELTEDEARDAFGSLPDTAADAFACFGQRVAAGLPAMLHETTVTIEGDPILSIYRHRADGTVDVVADATRDGYGAAQVHTFTCAGWDAEQRSAVDCGASR